MFEKLFTRPDALCRQLTGSLVEERRSYLTHCASQAMASARPWCTGSLAESWELSVTGVHTLTPAAQLICFACQKVGQPALFDFSNLNQQTMIKAMITVQRKGVINIPAEIRTELGLVKGDTLEASLQRGKVVLERVKATVVTKKLVAKKRRSAR